MTEDLYQIRLSGNILDGHERKDVVIKLSKLFGIEPTRADSFVNNRPSLIRKGYDLASAERLCERLKEIGVDCRTVQSQPEATPQPEKATQPKAASDSNTRTSQDAPLNNNHQDSNDLEQAISGNYSFAVGKTISEAWNLISGHKWPVWAGFLAIMGITLGIEFLVTLLGFGSQTGQQEASALGFGVGVLSWLLQVILCAPIAAGLALYCARAASGKQVKLGDIFSLYPSIQSLGLLQVSLNLLIFIGILLFIIPGIYLSIAYALALVIQADRNLGIWNSLEASRKAVTHRWFSIFWMFILLSILVVISALPLGIGLIWTLPMIFMAIGILYRDIFGVETAAA